MELHNVSVVNVNYCVTTLDMDNDVVSLVIIPSVSSVGNELCNAVIRCEK